LPGCVPLLGSTQQSSHLCPHSCHWLDIGIFSTSIGGSLS
jgi:hypothetical protein